MNSAQAPPDKEGRPTRLVVSCLLEDDGKQFANLLAIDTPSGACHVLADGSANGARVSPDGSRLAVVACDYGARGLIPTGEEIGTVWVGCYQRPGYYVQGE